MHDHTRQLIRDVLQCTVMDPRPVVRKIDSLGRKYYNTVQPKMSITVKNTKNERGSDHAST